MDPAIGMVEDLGVLGEIRSQSLFSVCDDPDDLFLLLPAYILWD